MSVENIYQQIKGQSQNLGTAKTFQTGAAGTKEGGLGSVDAVMRDMAERLSDAGLTSIEQLGQGQIPVYQRATVYPETKQGRFIGWRGEGDSRYEQVPTGRWLYQIATEYGDAGTQLSAPKLVPEAEVARLNLSGTQPKSVDITTGTKTGYINKATGEPIPQFNVFRKLGINPGPSSTWARNTAGDGQTIYRVEFDPTTGLPIFVNAQTHGRDQYADLLKIAAIGSALFAPQIGAALLPAGSSAAAALAVGSAVSGFIGSGGNLEAGIKAGLAGYLGGQAGSWASKASNSALVGNIASNMTRTAILGGDMEQALVASLVQSAPAVIAQNYPNFSQLPRAAQEAAVAATVDLMRTGGDNLGQIAVTGATKGATDYALSNIEGYKDLRPAQQDIIRTRVSNVLQGGDLSGELLQGAISFGSEAVQNEVNNEKAKKDGWPDYATQQAAKSLYGSKVTPDLYADKQETTEDEAKQIARDILGREPTEFEYMQLIGLTESEAAQNSDLAAIKYDESIVGTSLVKGVVDGLQGKDVTDAAISDSVTDFLSNKTDYSLSSGIAFPSTEGLKVEPVTDAGATVGESPVDYSLNINAPFEGLQMPTSPNITGMGGGQGLTVQTPEGVLSESGITPTGTALDLGDPESFINKPAPDVPTGPSFDPKEALKLAMKMFGAVGVGGAAFNAMSSGTSTRQPVNLNYGDIYKDAPIKGFAMRKGEDGKYTPFIGEKAQLAKGGLATRRK